MEFLSGVLMVIGSWFGFGQSDVEEVVAEPAPIVEEVVQNETEPEMENDAIEVEVEASAKDEDIATSEVGMSGEAPSLQQLNVSAPENESEESRQAVIQSGTQTMLVAGGCFWCVEADLEKTPGVLNVVSGYAGGSTENPTYKNYGSGGHREVVEVSYNADQISFEDILIVTMKTTDPTDDDGTFGDRGDKYSSAFYYETPEQKQVIENLIAEVDENGPYAASLAIDVEERPAFWVAEDNHQDYYKGTLTKVKYQFYRDRSGRTAFIQKYWGSDTGPTLPWRNELEDSNNNTTMNDTAYPWTNYVKPDIETLRATMDADAFRVTQEDGTERAGTSPLDKIYEPGIYVDVLSGEPLFSSKDKFDSGTGWPSFVAPITPEAVTAHEDRKLFVTRTETRSAIADNHLGHVFSDGPSDRGGLRYCMNGAALRFVPEADMAAEGYGDFLAML